MTASTTVQLAQRLAECTARKKELKVQLKVLQAEMDVLSDDIVTGLVEEGIASIKVNTERDGTWTVSANALMWAKLKEEAKPGIVKLLEGLGMSELLTINSTRLSFMYREHLEHEESEGLGAGLPPEFVDVLEVAERVTVSVRKA